jgi:DNA polymerase-4
VRDKAALGDIFTDLCTKLAADLTRKGYAAKTIGIKLRYDDFKIATRDQTLEGYTMDAKTIRQVAGQCLKRVPLDKKLRLLGVRAGTLEKSENLSKTANKGTFQVSNRAPDQSIRAQAAPEIISTEVPNDQLF